MGNKAVEGLVLNRKPWRIGAWLATAIVAIATTILMGYVVIRLIPNWLDQPGGLNPNQQGVERGRIRTAALVFLGGALAAVGAFFTALTFRLSRRGQNVDRFNKAIELLGHAKRSVRLGAIHALGQLAHDDPLTHHRVVLEVLVAYVRDRSPWPPVAPSVPSPSQPAASDIKAVMAVLARRRTSHDPSPLEIDLSDTNLRGIQAPKIRLCGAILSRTQLQQADLSGANLYDAALVGTNLDEADLERTNLAKASLQRAHLVGTRLKFAEGLDTAKLEGAVHDPLTTDWPDGFDTVARGLVPSDPY